jgi:DNA-binding transcriptional LysR family regulator
MTAASGRRGTISRTYHPTMEVRHLRYFVAVAEELNFGRAAARLHVAQPGLSQQIKSLEGELGLRLFDRDKRRVSLTEAGALLLAEAYAVLGRFDECVETMRRARTGSRPVAIRIGLVSEFSHSWGSELVAEVRRRQTTYVLAVEATPSATQIRAIEAAELDLGVVRSVPSASKLPRRLLDAEPLGACLPAGHRLAGKTAVRPAELSGLPLLWMPRSANPEMYDRVLATLAAAGLRAESVQSGGSASASFALVADGYGWTLAGVSDVAETAEQSAITWRPLAGVSLTAETWAVWSSAAPAAVADVLDVLAEIVPASRRTSPR